jgi:pimeloyl-ACP methyl ester carboxylesterase
MRNALSLGIGGLLGLAVLLAVPAYADPIDAALQQDPVYDPDYPPAVVELAILSDGLRMPAHAYLAGGAGPHPTVVLLHGFPGNERNLDIAQKLRRSGFNVLYFQYRGAWGAEGDYRVTQLADDALAVLDYLREPLNAAALRVDTEALTLLGHSLGGYTALAAGARDPSLSCVISLSPVNLSLWQAALQDTQAGGPGDELMAYADSLFMLKGLSGSAMRDELREADPESLDTTGFGPGLSGKAVLMLVGEDDQVTPAATMFDPVVAAYRQYESIDLQARKLSGDHSFSWSRIALSREILSWADAHCRSGR